MMNLEFPKLMSVGWSNRLIGTCSEGIDSEDGQLVFDLRRVEFLAPFGVTMLAATVLECLRQGKACSYRPPESEDTRKWMARIGFDALFLPNAEAALRTSSSVELRRFTDIDPNYVENLIEVMDHHLTLGDEDRAQITMYLVELMQNAKDHAHSDMGYFVCAQAYPKAGNLRISFVDVGKGIPTKLRTLKRYKQTRDDSHLLVQATHAGVTTREDRPGGMGLTFIRRYLRRSEGTLTLLSEKGKVAFQPKKIVQAPWKRVQRFPGTAVDIVMRPGD